VTYEKQEGHEIRSLSFKKTFLLIWDRGSGGIHDRPLQDHARGVARNCNEENEKTDEDGAT
jgi:hypothetical protein